METQRAAIEPGLEDHVAYVARFYEELTRDIRYFVVPVLTAFNLVYWLTDAWVFARVPGAAATLAVARAVTVGLAVLTLALLAIQPRRARAIAIAIGALTCLTTSAAFGQIGSPSSPWFHFLYPFALSPIGLYLAPGQRVAVTLLFGAAILGGYFLPNPGYLQDPMAFSTLGHFAYIEALGLGAGLYVDRARLRAFVTQQALERERGALAERVAEQTDALRRLARRLEAARESERVRVARELHDALGQTLTAMQLVLRVARNRYGRQPAGILPNLAQLGGLLDQLGVETRRLLHDLRPPALEELGLGAAVEWLAQDAARHGCPPCSVEVPGGRLDLPPEIATTTYRCIQEALTNVSRHAGAGAVRVRVGFEGGELSAEVEDDGVGIGRDQGDGLGLLGMRERAASVGGRVTITPGAQRGTRVLLRVPVPA